MSILTSVSSIANAFQVLCKSVRPCVVSFIRRSWLPLTWRIPKMKFPRLPHLRTAKFAPLAVFFLFFATNVTGLYLSPVLAPAIQAATPTADDFIPLNIPQSGDPDLDLIIFRAGEREGVDPRLIHAVIQQESKYHPEATSHVGAKGLMQLMPDTAKRFHCDDLKDEACNVEAGTKYLKFLLKRFGGDVSLAL